MDCVEEKEKGNFACTETDCKYWIDYEKDLNCTIVCANKNGPLTLRDVADRMGVSYVRIQQIEQRALKKMEKILSMSQLQYEVLSCYYTKYQYAIRIMIAEF